MIGKLNWNGRQSRWQLWEWLPKQFLIVIRSDLIQWSSTSLHFIIAKYEYDLYPISFIFRCKDIFCPEDSKQFSPEIIAIFCMAYSFLFILEECQAKFMLFLWSSELSEWGKWRNLFIVDLACGHSLVIIFFLLQNFWETYLCVSMELFLCVFFGTNYCLSYWSYTGC